MKTFKVKSLGYSRWNLQIDHQLDAALVLEGEQWVTENIPGVANDDRFESIDIVLDYVDKGVAITALAEQTRDLDGFQGDGFLGG